jgi:hypothetical protein
MTKPILFFIAASFLLLGCQPAKKEDGTVKAQSFPVQYMAIVDNTQDGCGTVLCAQSGDGFCAFPRGIPMEELTPGSVFWVQGNLSQKEDSPGTISTCMGMVKNVIDVQVYIRHSSW